MTTLAVAYHRIAGLEPNRHQIHADITQGLSPEYSEGYDTAIHDALHTIRQLAADTRPPRDTTTPPESPAAHLTTRNPTDTPINPDDEYDVIARTLSYHHLTTNGALITCTCGHHTPQTTNTPQRLQNAITNHTDHTTRHILQALATLYSAPARKDQ
ncbi:hypothetical protein [Actinobaculum sp. 352]|uniref:hypothetical protein n=1 Tax=Actinobaculum sp. 352 TaxID=2490946 RepID=UPI000F7E13B1|nr:hypothetical protein [Actinobaculum sp. 352]RTE48814.1 hypothetical protein EKN07_08905 [Actinobaculum sp. 352]